MRLLDGCELASVVLTEGERAGFNAALLKRASKGLVHKRHERIFGGQWYWKLQEQLETSGVNDYREALVKKLMEVTSG